MATNLTIPQSARIKFQEGMEHVAQQMQSRFREWAKVKTGCTGKASAHRKVTKAEMNDVTGRLAPTLGQELLLNHRYLFPRKADLATILDEDDAAELDLAVAPTGDIITQHSAAAGRKIDSIFLNGIMGANYEGQEDSLTSVTIAGAYSANVIAVNLATPTTTGSNVGLTLAKLIAGKSRFGKLEVYGQDQKEAGAQLCMAVSQEELDTLLYAVEEIQSADYNKVKALVDGETDYFMGIHFKRTELLPVASNVRACPMWVNTGVHLDFWYDVKTNIDTLATQSQAIQVYSRIKVGAARGGEENVVLVNCAAA